jgi:hypothetical protein
MNAIEILQQADKAYNASDAEALAARYAEGGRPFGFHREGASELSPAFQPWKPSKINGSS